MAVPNTTSSGAVFLPQHDNDRRVMLNVASIFLHQKRGRTPGRPIRYNYGPALWTLHLWLWIGKAFVGNWKSICPETRCLPLKVICGCGIYG